MKEKKIFDAVTDVRDDLIEEARTAKLRKKALAWKKWTAVAASVAIVAGIGGAMLLSSGIDGGETEDMSAKAAPISYAGPVLPLTAQGDLSQITAQRNTVLEFDDVSSLVVSDTYVLTNNSAEDKQLRLLYPYVSALNETKRFTPAVLLNGEPVQTMFAFGDYVGGFCGADERTTSLNLEGYNTYEQYAALLGDGAYLGSALADKEMIDFPVTVWRFCDVKVPEQADAATLAVDFKLPEGSRVLTYGMGGAYMEDSYRRYDFFARHAEKCENIVAFAGKAPDEYVITGWENGACETAMPEVTGRIEQTQMKLSELLVFCIGNYMTAERKEPFSDSITDDVRLDAVADMLQYTEFGNNSKERYQLLMLQDLIQEAFSMTRVCYASATVTVPADSNVELLCQTIKKSSFDYPGAGDEERQGIHEFEFATTLGSGLTFTAQNATLVLPEAYELVSNDFGFDIANDVTQAALDISTQPYSLEIKQCEP